VSFSQYTDQEIRDFINTKKMLISLLCSSIFQIFLLYILVILLNFYLNYDAKCKIDSWSSLYVRLNIDNICKNDVSVFFLDLYFHASSVIIISIFFVMTKNKSIHLIAWRSHKFCLTILFILFIFSLLAWLVGLSWRGKIQNNLGIGFYLFPVLFTIAESLVVLNFFAAPDDLRKLERNFT
jgi:hypothetical protein